MGADPRWGRRRVLRSGAVALGGAGAGWAAAAAALPAATTTTTTQPDVSPSDAAAVSAPESGNRTVAFRGVNQAGITAPPPAHLSLLGLDLVPGLRLEGLVRLLRLLTDDADRLSRGLPALADTEPELAVRPASLTVTFGLGPRMLREVAPRWRGLLAPLPAFATDRLDDAWGQTDLAVQVCAEDALTLAHARRMLLKDCAGLARPRWVQNGFRRACASEPDGTTMRNTMGQVDGTANLAEAEPDFARLVWSDDAGFEGGTFMVVRRIRAEMESWDRVDRGGREAAVGRRLDDGAPLTGKHEFDEPEFAATDALGLPVIDPASHIARARGRTPDERFLRRAYNYVVDDPTRRLGEDTGLVFVAFAADVARQFVPVQARLADLDRLNEWVTTIGSAVYAVPPGSAEGEYVGQRMLGAR